MVFYFGKMKKILFSFLSLLFWPLFVMADGQYYLDDAKQIVGSSENIADTFRKDYEELEKQILALDPDYAQVLQSKALTDLQKLTLARSYLAQKAFDYYKDNFLRDIEQHSVETNRKVVSLERTEPGFIDETWWLDRGVLDTDQCMQDGWQTCMYPDNFEDFYINVQESIEKDEYGTQPLSNNNGYIKSVTYRKDIVDKNVHQSCGVALAYQSSIFYGKAYKIDKLMDHATLRVGCEIAKYDEYHAWRNQEVEDTISGKHEIIGTEQIETPMGLQTFLVERQSKNMSEWKSNKLPATRYIGDLANYSSSISKTGVAE